MAQEALTGAIVYEIPAGCRSCNGMFNDGLAAQSSE